MNFIVFLPKSISKILRVCIYKTNNIFTAADITGHKKLYQSNKKF